MNTALNVFNLVWPYLAAGGGITIVTQILKRLANLEKNGVIIFLFHTVTVVTTAVTYLLGNHGLSYGLLLLHGAGFSGIANALYPAVKWADDKLVRIQKALKYVDQELPALEQVVNAAEQASAAAQASSQPAPTAPTPPPADF